MDKIGLSLSSVQYDDERIQVIDIFINGRRLDDTICEVERNFTDNRKGGPYGSIRFGDWIRTEFMDDRRRLEVLTCGGCMTDECWSIYTRVTLLEDKVIWRKFWNPHLKEWEGVELKFDFDKRQYVTELSNLASLSSQSDRITKEKKFKLHLPWKTKAKERFL